MKKFSEVDAQIRAAIDLMDSAGILNCIKAQAIEEATDAFVEFEGKRNSTSRWLDDYANKLRKGEQHGK